MSLAVPIIMFYNLRPFWLGKENRFLPDDWVAVKEVKIVAAEVTCSLSFELFGSLPT
jgi:hypothetical protein